MRYEYIPKATPAQDLYLLHVPAWPLHAKIASKILSDSKSSGQSTANKDQGIGKDQSINEPPIPCSAADLARFPKTWGNAVPICTAGVIGIYREGSETNILPHKTE